MHPCYVLSSASFVCSHSHSSVRTFPSPLEFALCSFLVDPPCTPLHWPCSAFCPCKSALCFPVFRVNRSLQEVSCVSWSEICAPTVFVTALPLTAEHMSFVWVCCSPRTWSPVPSAALSSDAVGCICVGVCVDQCFSFSRVHGWES